MSNRAATAAEQHRNSQDEDHEHEVSGHEHAPLLGGGVRHHHHPGSHVHFSGDDPATLRAKRRRRLFLSLAGLSVLVVISVLVIVGAVYGIRIRRSRAAKETPDYTKLPPPQPGLRNPSYLVRGIHGAVATETETCSQIGLDILKDGGKATDAAIGSALCGSY
jgi:hypothetical protein